MEIKKFEFHAFPEDGYTEEYISFSVDTPETMEYFMTVLQPIENLGISYNLKELKVWVTLLP